MKKEQKEQKEQKNLTIAITNLAIVMEGMATQMQLLREEMVRNRLSKDDLMDDDVTFRALVSQEISHVLSGELIE